MLSPVTVPSSTAALLLNLVDALALVWLILLFWIPFFWLLIHPAIRFWRRFGNRAFWVALPVWLAFASAFIRLRPTLFVQRIPRDAFTCTTGVVLIVLSAWLESQTRRALGLRRLLGIPEVNPGHGASGVVRSGIYARMRHPRYLEYMLTLVGMAFLTGSIAFFSLAILNILLYQMVAPLEERELLDHYGRQYGSYARDVPRFMPRLWRKSKPQVSS